MKFLRFSLVMMMLLSGVVMTPAINFKDDNTNEVEYIKSDRSGLQWKDELELARIIPTSDKKGIRITLPNSDPAKVIITDKKGKKKLKTLSYIAPAIIDISDLRKGMYQLILESHNEVVVKTFRK
jgi:hypothetical protein